jgi:hypothetical protein
VQICPTHAERIPDVLIRTSSVSVKRDGKALNSDACHYHAFLSIDAELPTPDFDSINYASLHDDGVIHADSKLVISCNVNDRKLEGNPGLRVAGFSRVEPAASAATANAYSRPGGASRD